jgi:hypothetical protein
VIEYLAGHEDARKRFLRGCSINGALLALSVGGGPTGRRLLPLLETDRDWDALTDRVYELAPGLEHVELIGLLDGIGRVHWRLTDGDAAAEAASLARAILERTRSQWRAARAPIPVGELEAWLALAALLTPRPEIPPIAVTWAELLPLAPPDLFDRAGLERFADWLTVAEVVFDYDPGLRDHLQFPGPAEQCVDGFLRSLRSRRRPPLSETEQAIRALDRIVHLFPALAYDAAHARGQLTDDAQQPRDEPAARPVTAEWKLAAGTSGRVDVERVLRDL